MALGCICYVRRMLTDIHRSRTEAVYREMRGDLLACRMRPGEKLRIAVLCQHYGASLGAVREALSKLTAEGLVTSEPQRGFQAASISAAELSDLTLARVEIESLCLGLAIEHGNLDWEERLLGTAHRLRRTPMRTSEDPGRLSDAWAKAHETFHEALVAACPNETLLHIRRQLYAQSERYRRLSVPLADVARDVEREHRGLLAAALDRDTDQAVRALGCHIRETTRVLLQAQGDLAELVA